MKKVSEWLNELGTHSILDCQAAKDNFREETGEQPCWGAGFDRDAMARQIEARGKGGSLAEATADTENVRYIGALDVAYACYLQYAGDEEAAPKFGMGSQFREYVAAIARNGC